LIPSGSGKNTTNLYLPSGHISRAIYQVLKTKVKLYLNHTPSPPGEGWGEVRRGFAPMAIHV